MLDTHWFQCDKLPKSKTSFCCMATKSWTPALAVFRGTSPLAKFGVTAICTSSSHSFCKPLSCPAMLSLYPGVQGLWLKVNHGSCDKSEERNCFAASSLPLACGQVWHQKLQSYLPLGRAVQVNCMALGGLCHLPHHLACPSASCCPQSTCKAW